MLVNEYLPGQGIALHRNYEPFDRTVVSMSLLAGCVMDFRRAADGRRESLWPAPRSLLVLSDEARYDWAHGIARRKSDVLAGSRTPRARRLSVTFRTRKHRRRRQTSLSNRPRHPVCINRSRPLLQSDPPDLKRITGHAQARKPNR